MTGKFKKNGQLILYRKGVIMNNVNKDFFAVTLVGGGSSFSWNSSPKKAVFNVVRSFIGDWSRFYKTEDAEIVVMVFDVTGYTSVNDNGMGDSRFIKARDDDGNKKTIQMDYLVKIKTPKKGTFVPEDDEPYYYSSAFEKEMKKIIKVSFENKEFFKNKETS